MKAIITAKAVEKNDSKSDFVRWYLKGQDNERFTCTQKTKGFSEDIQQGDKLLVSYYTNISNGKLYRNATEIRVLNNMSETQQMMAVLELISSKLDLLLEATDEDYSSTDKQIAKIQKAEELNDLKDLTSTEDAPF